MTCVRDDAIDDIGRIRAGACGEFDEVTGSETGSALEDKLAHGGHLSRAIE